MTKAIIIEDEDLSCEILKDALEHFKDIELAAVCKTPEEGKAAIEALHPDLVFSDVQFGSTLSFEMFAELGKIDFDIIFLSSNAVHANKAFKFFAIDYILKPFTKEELTIAINNFRKKQFGRKSVTRNENLFHELLFKFADAENKA